MASISLIKIEEKHLRNPKEFANEDLPSDQQAKFHIIKGRVYCPIEFTQLIVQTLAIKTDCCKSVFSVEGFIIFFKTHRKCICEGNFNRLKVTFACFDAGFSDLF
ncbi:MAG: hypothetical protein KR126chlam5_01554 [Candidatus Anoxychlamydiales bacterium]|nr:hypothetical protein [Candidatus Anoxychlamydiales bacterium]NGX53241.1 hypothetical protein [Candidatus Anoxychlamydiales bacterium]